MISFILSLTCAIGFYHLFYKINKPIEKWRSAALLAALILSRPLSLLWQRFFMYGVVESTTFINITTIHIACYLTIWVLLTDNRIKGLVAAAFSFSIINITHIPIGYIIFIIFYPFTKNLEWIDILYEYPHLYYGAIFINNIVIAIICYYASHWLSKTSKKPPLKIYLSFSLIFVLFPLGILFLWEEMPTIIDLSYIIYAIIGLIFLGLPVFLFYLYTRLTLDKSLSNMNKTEDSPQVKTHHIFQFSKREKEVVEALLSGHLTYKELSNALNISVNTVKTHLKNIYSVTGASSIASLLSILQKQNG